MTREISSASSASGEDITSSSSSSTFRQRRPVHDSSTPSTPPQQQQPTQVVYASPRPSSAIGRWFRQLRVVCHLNAILTVRYWKATLLQTVIMPLVVIGIVFGVQTARSSKSGAIEAADSSVVTWDMEGIRQCKPAPLSNACMTIVYTPQNEETNAIMNHFRTLNLARTQEDLVIEPKVWDDMNSIPSSNMGIVPVPSDQFIYDYSLAHPDTIQLGVVFTKQVPAAPATSPINWAYQIYYNTTHATNMSTLPDFRYSKYAGYDREVDADDSYGRLLPSMVRAMDESLITYLDPNQAPAQLDFSLKSFPTPARQRYFYSAEDSTRNLSNLMALPACITMVMAMLRVTREKESKCKESMQMMGLGPLAYWTGQWLTAWIVALIQASVMVGLGHAFKMTFFTNSNGVVVWLTFLLLTYSMTLLGFFLTTFCRKSGAALAFGFALSVAVLISVPIVADMWKQLWVDMIHWVPYPDGRKIEEGALPPAELNTWIVSYFVPFMNFARLWGQISDKSIGSMDRSDGKYMPGLGFNWTDLTTFNQSGKKEFDLLQDMLPQPVTALSYYGFNIIIFAILTLYFDQIIPNEHGHARSPFFFIGSIARGFRWIRHGGSSGLARVKNQDAQKVMPYEGTPPTEEDQDVILERERAVQCQTDVAIRISNLTKIYTKSGEVSFFKKLYITLCCCFSKTRRRSIKVENRAVDRLNLLTEPDELFALLGQNGAGKSTTMQMLYGVSNPTSGNAFLFNRSIRGDMDEIRSTMGVCPQHDILFSDLTCWEHLQLYAGIKDLPAEALLAGLDEADQNLPATQKSTWIRSRLEAVQLWKDRNTMAGRLSGGMKRRLSTIISTIGDPQVLILDEPTTGMDPIHRRHVWTFLAQFKRGRSILLTTHSMEEADALGDKVAIMVSGHLKAIGNTTRLKNRFGTGYRVEVALGHNNSAHTEDATSQKQLEQELTEETRRIMPEAVLTDQSGGVVVFGIPLQAIGRMADLTAMLEKKQAKGQVKHWGIAQTSLEEVFLSLVRSAEERH